MSWKDELRKAPFGMRQEARRMNRENREQTKYQRTSGLERLDTHLVQNMDNQLRKLMQEDSQAKARGQPTPHRGHYDVTVPQLKIKIQDLLKTGMTEEQIQEYIRKKYKAEFVTLGQNDRVEIKMKGFN